MNLYTLIGDLKSSGLYVFTPRDISRLLHVKRSVAYVYIHRMKEKEMIYPVEKGKFAIYHDPFVVSTQLIYPSYISFITAFYLHGRVQQTVDMIFVVSPKKKRALSFLKTPIKFITFPPSRVFGYRSHKMGESQIMLADLEKAAVDAMYLPRYLSIATVFECLVEGVNAKLLEDYARKMDCEAVIRRAGYILDQLGEETELRPSTSTSYRLNPTIKEKGNFNAKWKLYVNEVIG